MWNTKGGVEITGTKDVQKILDDIAPKYARNLMRATIQGVASQIVKEAKQNVTSKRVKKAMKAKRKKSPPDAPVSVVYFKDEGFMWRWLEYGTQPRTVKKTGRDAGSMPEKPFLRPVTDKMRANFPRVLTEEFGKKLEGLLAREAKKRARK